MGLRARRSAVLAKRRTLPLSNASFQAPKSSEGASISMRIGSTPTLVNVPAAKIAATTLKNTKTIVPMPGAVNAKRSDATTKIAANPMGISSPRRSSGTTM
jgi:hypothetical protein